jgi:tRNA(Arg) A34 adenosine deaminase TadA
MAEAVAYPARIRIWKETKTWRRAHGAKGIFGEAHPGLTEDLRLPVYIHPCSVCGTAVAPFGYNGIWFCREHRP